ncbi:hypothetical protein VKT23_019119 [Stygiomarasmius scandens]|uniref:JmjC domain-containing protein n=1 Tax=Marasmiellus scandens TaxID=2682957 RepID=A0ABR1IML1_9AGAR
MSPPQAFVRLADVVDFIRNRDGGTRYYSIIQPKENENQADWIARVGLTALFQGSQLSDREWLVLNTSRQALSNHIHNPKRKERGRPWGENPAKRQRNVDIHLPCVDLTEGVKGRYLPEESRVVEWRGDRGTVVKTCAPTIVVDGKNILQEEETYIEQIANTYGFAQGTGEHIIFLHPESPGLHDAIRFHLAQNRLVLVSRGEEWVPQPVTNQDLSCVLKMQRVRPDRSIQAHSMRSKSSYNEMPEETIPMDIETFVARMEDLNDSLFILDVFINPSGGIPAEYTSLDDLELGLTETAHSMPGDDRLVDKAWALAHHPGTFTPWHHDCDGKVTAIVPRLGAKLWSAFIPSRALLPRLGAKLWSAFIPSRALLPSEVANVIVRLCEQKLVLPEPHEGTVVTALLKEGDMLFQPAGLVHQVVTPIPSYFHGSSFWMYESLHLTRFSRLIDANHGLTTTNVDHQDISTFASMVRLALSFPTASDLKFYKRPIVSLYDMIVNKEMYIASHLTQNHTSHCQDEQDLVQARNKLISEMDDVPHLSQAIKILEKVLSMNFGMVINRNKAKTYLHKTGGEWFMPGESAEIDFKALCGSNSTNKGRRKKLW